MLSFQPAFAFEYTLAPVSFMIDIAVAVTLLAETKPGVRLDLEPEGFIRDIAMTPTNNTIQLLGFRDT